LTEHPDVSQAAVAVHGSADTDLRLVAYVVPRASIATVNLENMRQYLLRQLPDYMVPGEFVMLDRLPLTPNGKLDRKALLAPQTTMATAAVFVAPETPTEQALAGLWQETLRIDRIGADDNFFDSGGHSLLAMQLARRIRERFDVELPLQNVLQRPHLKDLAAHIDNLSSMARAEKELTTGKLAEGFDYGEV